MNRAIIVKIADEIEKHWDGPTHYKNEVPEWDGPTGKCWCSIKKKYVDPNQKCNLCPECTAISQVDIHPPRYLHPTEMSW